MRCLSLLLYRNYSDFIVFYTVMRPADNKRATQFLPEQVPLLKQNPPDTNAVVPSPSELESKRSPLSSGRLAKRPGAKRPSAPSLADPGRKIIRGTTRPLALRETSGLGNSAGSDLAIREESPWDTFEKYYECDLAGTVAVCVRRSGRRAVWAIRQYPCSDADRILEIIKSTRHRNVDSVRECFCTSDTLYTLNKFHPLTLEHVVACRAFPDQHQLAAIMSQVYFPVPRGDTTCLIVSSFLMDCHISWPKISSIPPWIVLAS